MIIPCFEVTLDHSFADFIFLQLASFVCLLCQINQGNLGFRHWAEQGDDLPRFGWTRHDGVSFGEQEVLDRGVVLKTSFVKEGYDEEGARGGDWTARIEVHSEGNKKR